MNKIRLVGYVTIISFFLLSSVFIIRVDQPTFAQNVTPTQSCDDCNNLTVKPEDCCKKPVRKNGDADDGCYCFTCEYGTSKAHIVCSKNETIKTKLFKLAEDKDSQVTEDYLTR